MFRATQCSSSGESIVSIHHQVYITPCRWSSGVQVREEISDLHTRRPPTRNDIYQMMYWYNWLSWWWALGCSKHVEKWNKHIKKCVRLVINTKCHHVFLGKLCIIQKSTTIWCSILFSTLYIIIPSGISHQISWTVIKQPKVTCERNITKTLTAKLYCRFFRTRTGRGKI